MDHQLSRLPNGQFTCALCQWTWRTQPRSPCVGVPRFDYGQWPSTLYTATQLRRMKLKPGEPPDGYYPLVKSPSRRFLYDITKATPHRIPTERQREAETSMRAALVTTDTCRGCGTYDGSHGQSRSGVTDGYCAACWRAEPDEMQRVQADMITRLARCEHETEQEEETAMNIRPEQVQAILANPFYAMTVAPPLVKEHPLEMSDEQWVRINAQLMQGIGADQWLAQVLAFLQSGDGSLLADPSMNPCHAVIIATIFAQDHEPMMSQETWVQSNVLSIQEMSVERWLMQWLNILEGDARHQRRNRPAAFSRQKPAQEQARQTAAQEEERVRLIP